MFGLFAFGVAYPILKKGFCLFAVIAYDWLLTEYRHMAGFCHYRLAKQIVIVVGFDYFPSRTIG